MLKNERICHCGTCSTFADRGLKFSADMVMDGECAMSIMATATVMSMVAANMMMPSFAKALGIEDREPNPDEYLIVSAMTLNALEQTRDVITTYFDANRAALINDVNAFIEKRNAMVEKLAGLQKDH